MCPSFCNEKYAMMAVYREVTQIMTQENNRRYRSEKEPPNKKKADRILNYLITLVVILIVIVAAFIFTDDGKEKVTTEAPKETVKEQPTEKNNHTEKKQEQEATEQQADKEMNEADLKNPEITSIEDLKQSESAKIETVNDGLVQESIEDPNWKPYETKQQETGATHVSSYDKTSVDWQEKITAIASITGLSEQDMTIWFIKNNGGTDRSIGTVSSKDQTKKYRVSLVWVDQQGWKPEKVEVLQQLEGAY